MFSFQTIHTPRFFIIHKKIIKEIFLQLEKNLDIPQNGIINIVFLPDNQIQNLNKQYRKIDSSTDVLSFHYFDDFTSIDSNEIAGEIILSEKKIISQWEEFKLWSELEFYKLIIHSALHILWYDHEIESDYLKMKEKEDIIWKIIFN